MNLGDSSLTATCDLPEAQPATILAKLQTTVDRWIMKATMIRHSMPSLARHQLDETKTEQTETIGHSDTVKGHHYTLLNP